MYLIMGYRCTSGGGSPHSPDPPKVPGPIFGLYVTLFFTTHTHRHIFAPKAKVGDRCVPNSPLFLYQESPAPYPKQGVRTSTWSACTATIRPRYKYRFPPGSAICELFESISPKKCLETVVFHDSSLPPSMSIWGSQDESNNIHVY